MKKETNYEHYKDEIIKNLLIGGSCRFKKEYILKPKDRIALICPCSCSECEIKTKEWFNAPINQMCRIISPFYRNKDSGRFPLHETM